LVAKGRLDKVITKDQTNTYIKNLVGPLNTKIRQDSGKRDGIFGVPAFGGQPLEPFDAALVSINAYLDGTGFSIEEKTAIKADLVQNAFKALEFTKVETMDQAREIANTLIRQKAIQLNPNAGLLPTTPNAIMKFSGQLENILPGKSRATPSKKVTEKGEVVQQKSTGKWFIRPKDGSPLRPITPEQAKKMIDNGGT